MVANEPSSLPAYSSIYSGTLNISDSGQLGSTTIWQAGLAAKSGFFSESASPQFIRQVVETWSLDPIVVPEKLEAMRAACQWMIYGPEMLSPHDMSLLADPDHDPSPGRHFGVQEQLARLPRGWIHHGKFSEMPWHICYKGHYHGTWVWVMPDGLDSLANFAVVIQNIARVNSNSLTLRPVPPNPGFLTFLTSDWVSPSGQRFMVQATVSVDVDRNLLPDTPYYAAREDDVGTESSLRSQISAAGTSP
jgi:hypothetical protein